MEYTGYRKDGKRNISEILGSLHWQRRWEEQKIFPIMKELFVKLWTLISKTNMAEVAVHYSAQNQLSGGSLSTHKIKICAMAYKALQVLAHHIPLNPLLTLLQLQWPLVFPGSCQALLCRWYYILAVTSA